MGKPWSRHRHWHDERGRTHKQNQHVPPILAAALRYQPQTPAPEAKPWTCWRCGAELDIRAECCGQCQELNLPF